MCESKNRAGGGGKIIIGRRPWREPISTHCPAKAPPPSLMQANPPFPHHLSSSYSQRPSVQRLRSNQAAGKFSGRDTGRRKNFNVLTVRLIVRVHHPSPPPPADFPAVFFHIGNLFIFVMKHSRHWRLHIAETKCLKPHCSGQKQKYNFRKHTFHFSLETDWKSESVTYLQTDRQT